MQVFVFCLRDSRCGSFPHRVSMTCMLSLPTADSCCTFGVSIKRAEILWKTATDPRMAAGGCRASATIRSTCESRQCPEARRRDRLAGLDLASALLRLAARQAGHAEGVLVVRELGARLVADAREPLVAIWAAPVPCDEVAAVAGAAGATGAAGTSGSAATTGSAADKSEPSTVAGTTASVCTVWSASLSGAAEATTGWGPEGSVGCVIFSTDLATQMLPGHLLQHFACASSTGVLQSASVLPQFAFDNALSRS